MGDVHAVATSWRLDEGPISREEAREKIAWMSGNHESNAPGKLVHLCFAISLVDEDEIIGWCGLDNTLPEYKHPVLFYLLKRSYWNQGYATEAARAVIDYAFRRLDLPRIDSGAEQGNIASKRVMEKIGLHYLGEDEEGGYCFTLSKEEYCK